METSQRRTSAWKPVLKGLAATFAALFILSSTMYEQRPVSYVTAVLIVLSVIALHWLLWRFIIPVDASLPEEARSFFVRKGNRGFFSGTISFGYVMVALHCYSISEAGPLGPSLQSHFLGMGLFWIGLGTAARLREAFAAAGAPPADDGRRMLDPSHA